MQDVIKVKICSSHVEKGLIMNTTKRAMNKLHITYINLFNISMGNAGKQKHANLSPRSQVWMEGHSNFKDKHWNYNEAQETCMQVHVCKLPYLWELIRYIKCLRSEYKWQSTS